MASCFLTKKIVAIVRKNNSKLSPIFSLALFLSTTFPRFLERGNHFLTEPNRFQEYAAKFQNDGARVALRWDDGAEWLRDDLQGRDAEVGGLGGWWPPMLGAVPFFPPKKRRRPCLVYVTLNRDIERYVGVSLERVLFIFVLGSISWFPMVVFWLGRLPEFWFFAPFFRGTWRRRDGQHLCCIQGGHIHWKNDISETAQQNKLQDAEGIQVTGGWGWESGGWRDVDRDVFTHTHTLPDKVFLVWYFDFFFFETFICCFCWWWVLEFTHSICVEYMLFWMRWENWETFVFQHQETWDSEWWQTSLADNYGIAGIAEC